MDGLAARTRWLICLAVLTVFAGLALAVQPREGPPEPATWRLDGRPDRSATKLPILVQERACASGKPAEGRIESPTVSYNDDSVIIAVRVRPTGGDVTALATPRPR